MIYLVLIYTVIILFTVPDLVKRKLKKELAVFSVLCFIAFVLGLLYVLDVPIPSPMKGLHKLIVEKWGIQYPKQSGRRLLIN